MGEDKRKIIDSIMQREFTRKQFLGAMLGVVVSVMGFSTIVGLFTKQAPQPRSNHLGYGEQGYGP